VRRLIINADDFGLTAGVNRGIIEAYRAGTVTSATLMAGGRAFADAVQLAASVPQLGIGCHVQLVDGSPVSDPERVPTLLERPLTFRHNLTRFAWAALRHRIDFGEAEREAAAQVRRLMAAGVSVTHLDTHKHAHMFPSVLQPLLRAARACGVRSVRNPFAPPGAFPLAQLIRRPDLWKRSAQVRLLRRLAAGFRQAVKEAGMLTTHGSFGIEVTGALDERLFAAIAAAIPEGTWEFVCHPGYDDAELAKVPTRLRGSRRKELAVLTSGAARAALESRGVELISYRELAN
jgi:chitin disaccharide deacetylase